MSEHSLLSPSSMDRIIGCPASLAQSDGEPNNGNKYAWEGTAAHTLASDCLEQQLPALAFLGRIIEVIEEGVKVDEFEVDEEMAGNVQIYLDHINDIVSANDSELYIEQRVEFTDVLEADEDDEDGEEVPDSAGTSDVVMLHPLADVPGAHELHIVDLKYGRGVRVDAEDNSQMMTYALGALEKFVFTHDIASIRMTICQPRLNHLSEAEIAPSQLRNWAEYTLKPGCHKSLRLLRRKRIFNEIPPLDTYNPTTDNCKFCKGKATCVAIRNVIKEAIFSNLDDAVEFSDLNAAEPLETPGTDEILDEIFPKIDLIYDWLGAVRAKVEARLFAGALYTNAKLVRGRKGNSAWKDKDLAEKDLKGMRLKQEDMYKMTLITPTVAKELLKDNPKRLKTILANIGQADGRIGVALATDPAPAYIPPQIEFDDLDAGAEDLA